MSARFASAFVLPLLTATLGSAQVVYPEKPERYDVNFRYRIRADRDERIRQYRAMTAELDKLGFVATRYPNDDLEIFDPAAETKSGTVPGKNAAALLGLAAIKTVIVRKSGEKLPDDAKKPVQVRIQIPANLAGREQRLLHEQTVAHLGRLGFVEAIGYQHDGFGTIRGALPAGVVPRLLKDLRTLPGGWLFSADSRDALPVPFSTVVPIRYVEVLSDLPADAPVLTLPQNLGKFTAALKALVADPSQADKPIVVEAIFESDLGVSTRDERIALRTVASGASVEGIVGRVATIRFPQAALVSKLADYADVRHIRLPRRASETAGPTTVSKDTADVDRFLKTSNLNELHKRGYDGTGVRVVVLASEYPDFAKSIGHGLPANTKLFDLTGEVRPTMEPLPAQPGRVGTGTAVALTAAAAAPRAEIVCVRIDPSSFHQPYTVARAVAGELGYSEALVTRSEEMAVLADRLLADRRGAVERYRKAFANLTDDPKVRKEREEAAAELTGVQKREADFKTLSDRFAVLKSGLEGLKGTGIVVNTLVWETGHPHDGLSELSQYLNRKFAVGAARSAIKASKLPPAPAWIQASSISTGQMWAGAFLDRDDNGVMEFTDAATAPARRWTPELNFFNYTSLEGKLQAALPKDLKVRVSVQWREPHNENAFLPVEPVFPIRLRLLKQVDPEGKMFATDDLVEVARTVGTPVRLASTNSSGTYEASFDVVLPSEGVYALRVEGGLAAPAQLRAIQQGLEIRPRIMVEIIDTAQAAKGTVRFDTYAPPGAGVGIPGDAAAVLTIGQSRAGEPQKPTSVTGTGPGVALSGKPDLLIRGESDLGGQGLSGTAIGAGYAGGLAASVLTAGVRPAGLIQALGLKPGAPLVLPTDWIETLTPRGVRK